MWLAQTASDVDWKSVGVVGLIVVAIVVTGIRRIWMFTWTHDAIVKQLQEQLDLERKARLEWQTMALTQAGVLDHAVQTTIETVRTVSPYTPPLEEPKP